MCGKHVGFPRLETNRTWLQLVRSCAFLLDPGVPISECQSAVIQLQSILRTYSDTFCDSTDVPKMFQSCCNLRYKLHFVLFCCDFLTTGLTHWSMVHFTYTPPHLSIPKIFT